MDIQNIQTLSIFESILFFIFILTLIRWSKSDIQIDIWL